MKQYLQWSIRKWQLWANLILMQIIAACYGLVLSDRIDLIAQLIALIAHPILWFITTWGRHDGRPN